MKTLVIEYDPNSGFGTLVHPYNKRFVSFISQGIKPLTRRKFDEQTRRWSVHSTRIPQAVMAGRKYFDHVDYSSLPEQLQITVVQFIERCQRNGPAGPPVEFISAQHRPHDVLFVKENAPPEVIKAAWKALVLKYHPDQQDGKGDPEQFQRVHEAYEELKKK
jgi:DnaJ-domain-containing protein 1